MRHISRILIITLLLLSLCACSSGTSPEGTQPPEQTGPEASVPTGFIFTHNGTQIAMNLPAEPIIAALGEPVSFTEQTSCAFTGLDKTYYYGSFYMDTYPTENGDRVYSLWIVDDTVTTQEGLYIGAAQSQVEALYGADGFNGSNAYILEKEQSRLTILVENGVVTSIQYDAILN